MADTVNAYLERMLPELEDLEKWGLFTRSEIKEVVRRRREFEYHLKRPSRIRDDFLRYVDYETKLESLRRLRKKVVVRDLNAAGKRWSGHMSDGASAIRIISIYKRAVARFGSDMSLWLKFLEYCRKHSPKQMRRVLARALQLHPNIPGLWMYAASWDFEHNLDVSAARALMQRGLRMCPHSEDLWLEYFRMELSYAQKLKSRMLVLGIESEEIDAGKEQRESDLSVKLAWVIFKNAIVAVPSSARFRQRFVEVLDRFALVKSTIANEIYASMTRDFPKDENCWDWKGKYKFQTTSSWKDAVKVYEEAVGVVSSARMYELYAKFLEGLLDSGDKRVPESLLELYDRGEEVCASINFLEGHVRLLTRNGFLDRARALTEQFCNGPLRSSSRLWVLRLTLEIQHGGLQMADISKLFLKALQLVQASEGKDIWKMALEYFSGMDTYLDIILRHLETALGGKGGGQELGAVAWSAVSWFLHFDGVEKARQLYNRFLVLPGPSLYLFKRCIGLEAERGALGDQEAVKCMRRLFDAALEIYGREDVGIWLDYCALEKKVGNASNASTVYFRAKKTLSDPSLFIQRHQLLFA
ncbi:hypothetical protein SELMODRAFT_419083 [Selaginella moellendorffii]|uniref:U3 small nucleolar RNA-associated protein 6 n=1 Tax=Selaginella moellendorffii TaxID=88036 RepID=D8S7S6_SELML|nr:U3 small nucleolar RNA-associated protein 6 homolog [Selaginella moellendorffii]EFJ19658.1 hypothetical protein SELMODRAFT_419083 [Selaginella moellendorffii]|eukprot:XP_002979250.1 U3 small nucleolar RNA-associated protein 6 homolog [Selaginella moellendorffii]